MAIILQSSGRRMCVDRASIRIFDNCRPGRIQFPLIGYAQVFPALIATGLMLGSIGLLLSSTIKQLQNFSRVMNFVIYLVFFYQPHCIYCGKWQKRPFCCTIYAPIVRFLMPLSGFALRFMVKQTLLQQFG